MSERIALSGTALTGVHTDGEPYRRAVAALPTDVRLGCVVQRGVRKAPAFSKYFDAGLASVPPPASTNYRAKAAAPLARMLRNDVKGCCVISDRFHTVGLYTANDAPATVMGTDAEVDAAYAIWNPPPMDNGCVITQVLDYHRDRGLRMAGQLNRIDGYVALDWTNKLQVKTAIYLMPGIPLGIDLPQAWTQNAVWDVTDSPIVGGHDVPAIDYDDRGVYVASWGRVYLITWPAFMSRRWLGEAHVVLSADWYGNDKVAPCGVDAATLAQDVAIIKSGGTPPIDPVPPPTPTPIPTPTPAPAQALQIKLQGEFQDWTGKHKIILEGLGVPVTKQDTES